MNRTLRGWANYFSVGTVSTGVSSDRRYAAAACVGGCRYKHKGQGRTGSAYQSRTSTSLRDSYVCTRLGRGPSVGEGMSSCPRAGCGKSARPVR